MPVYNCSLCQLVTPIKCHYERHLLTKKHMMNEKVSLKSSQSHPKVIPNLGHWCHTKRGAKKGICVQILSHTICI